MSEETDEHGRKVVFETISGSHLYGTADENSDRDIRTVVIPTMDELIGLGSFEHNVKDSPEKDVVTYSLKKYVKLLLKGNPNVHEWLWVPWDCILYIGRTGRIIRTSRTIFISDRIGKSILGYLKDQIKRGFGGTEQVGEKRKHLIEEFGYNTKAAYHALRLCYVGQHLYTNGEIRPRQPEHLIKTMLMIKKGQLSKKDARDTIEAAEELFKVNREENKAEIPGVPESENASEIVRKIYYDSIVSP